MSRTPRKPGDARLSRDGTAKLDGKVVGRWWKDENDLFRFVTTDERGSTWSLFRHELMSLIRGIVEAEQA